MKFSIYNKKTGQILRTISVPLELINNQLYSDEWYIDGWFPDNVYYIENGIPTIFPIKPSEHHIFDYSIKQWVDPRTSDTEWPIVRDKRNQLLAASDWTQLPDVPLATKEAWAIYRQALRDITEQPDPFNIIWPTPPN